MDEQIIVKPHDFKLNFDVQPLQEVVSKSHLEEFIEYKKRTNGLSMNSAIQLRSSTCDILSYCNPHDASDNMETTHLVVGYVQSGKTMSFTSLIELALDYKYRIAIVFTGITNNLLNQTSARLKKDLKCDIIENNRHFKIFTNPDESKVDNIARLLRNKDNIIVIPVLKHYDRINKLTALLNTEKIKNHLDNETVLIIDDEADQASLNNFGRQNSRNSEEDKMSRTYEAIVRMRNSLNGNSYIQYTATPQANILINTLDILSPKTHTLLIPGEGYCGGKQFFGMDANGELFNGKLIEIIPQDEVFHKRNNPFTILPQSLERAVMLHMWAVTIIVRYLKVDKINQLSMMVHMDETLEWNRVFCSWINELLVNWQNTLDDIGSDKRKFLLSSFKSTMSDALRFYDDIDCNFEELEPLLIETIEDTNVYLITGESDDVDTMQWDDFSSNILVGAQMLNRGFTVENLATTYMSRHTVSVTNADTIEQRCRFFGYKMKYIRSCRVFLPNSSKRDYESCIESEEELRNAMSRTKSMDELGHKILTSPNLNPTRKSVLSIETVNSRLIDMHEFSAYEKETTMEYNRKHVERFINLHKAELKPYINELYNANDFTGLRFQTYFRVGVEEAIAFLKSYIFTSAIEKRYCADTVRYLYYLSNKNDNLINDILILYMGNGKEKKRSINPHTFKLTSNLFEGESSHDVHNNVFYPGTRNIHSDETITIQIHNIRIRETGIRTASLSIYYPEKLATRYCNSDF